MAGKVKKWVIAIVVVLVALIILIFAALKFSNSSKDSGILSTDAGKEELQLKQTSASPMVNKDVEPLNDHIYVAENDRYELYMNEEYLSIIVRDKVSGSYMESAISYDDGNNNQTWVGAMKSAVVLTLLYKDVDTKQADLVNDRVKIEVGYTENGFAAKIYWSEYQLGFTLDVALEEDGLVVTIPDNSVIEDSNQYFIGTISMYPFLGHSYLDEKDGYMFIPDGNGAFISLDDKEGRFSSGYSS